MGSRNLFDQAHVDAKNSRKLLRKWDEAGDSITEKMRALHANRNTRLFKTSAGARYAMNRTLEKIAADAPFPPEYYQQPPFPWTNYNQLIVGMLIGMATTLAFEASKIGPVLFVVLFFSLLYLLRETRRQAKEQKQVLP